MSQLTHECFADEIAIDFPSVGNVVDRMRDAFLGAPADAGVLRADVSLSQREAEAGHTVSLRVPVVWRHDENQADTDRHACAGQSKCHHTQYLGMALP